MAQSEHFGKEFVESDVIARFSFIAYAVPPWFPDEPRSLESLESDLIPKMSSTINARFQDRVTALFRQDARVVISRIETGSIWGEVVVVLAGTLTVYEFIAKYKDFYEGLLLLRTHLRAIIRSVLHPADTMFPPYVVEVALTNTPQVSSLYHTPGRSSTLTVPNFVIWYLILTNLILMGGIALLVLWILKSI